MLTITKHLAGNNSAGGTPPRYSVDPFWPKPLPNQWALGQVAGLHVDNRNHLWIIHRPRTIEKLETGAAENPPTARCCRPAPAVIEFDPAGNVANVERIGMEKVARIDPDGNKTPTLGRERTFLEDLFGNIGTVGSGMGGPAGGGGGWAAAIDAESEVPVGAGRACP